MENEKIRQLKEEIKSEEGRLEFLKKELYEVEQREEMKKSLLSRVSFSSQVSNEDLGTLCRSIKIMDVFTVLTTAEMVCGDFIYDPKASSLSVAEVLCLLSNKNPRVGGNEVEHEKS